MRSRSADRSSFARSGSIRPRYRSSAISPGCVTLASPPSAASAVSGRGLGAQPIRNLQERFDRGDEVVGARERPGEPGERVAFAARRPAMLSSIAARAVARREADEHRPVVGDRAVRHVPTEDVAEALLVGAATCESGGLSSSSTLSGFVRPITRSCSPTESASHAAVSCAHFCRSRTSRRLRALRQGSRTSPGASISVGFSVPSMKPVRSRSCRYGQLEVSSAIAAARTAIAARQRRRRRRRRCPRARARRRAAWPASRNPASRGRRRRTRELGRRIVRRDLPPELGPESHDEVDAAHRRPRLPQRRNGRYELGPVCPLAVELEVRVGDVPRAKIPPCGVLIARSSQSSRGGSVRWLTKAS